MQSVSVIFRTLTPGETIPGVNQNVSEFNSYLNEAYLSQGYVLKSEHLLRVLPGENGSPYQTEWAFYLAKEIEDKKSK